MGRVTDRDEGEGVVGGAGAVGLALPPARGALGNDSLEEEFEAVARAPDSRTRCLGMLTKKAPHDSA